MDIAEQPTTPAFTQLPVELLELILGIGITDPKPGSWQMIDDFPTLKNLRLACRQYTYLPRLMSNLFRCVRLEALPQHLEIVAATDLQPLKPYVRRVVFRPGGYSWAMKKDIFREFAMHALVKKECERHNDGRRLDYRDEDILTTEGGWEVFIVAKGIDGNALFSVRELDEGFERYMAQANAARVALDNGEVQKAWTRALKQFQNVGVFRMSAWDREKEWAVHYREKPKGKSWKELGCDVLAHAAHGKQDWRTTCCRVHGPVGEAVFSAAIASLKAAGSTITELDINYVSDGGYMWADDGQLDGLDLSRLQRLLFRPGVPPLGELCVPYSFGPIAVPRRDEKAALALVRASAKSLKDLVLSPGGADAGLFSWPPIYEDVIVLPVLERFKAAFGLNLSAFSRFVLSAENLEHLELDRCRAWRCNGTWRDLWRAIRHHPMLGGGTHRIIPGETVSARITRTTRG